MPVTFSKKWFNPLYFILNDLFEDNNIRTILIYGGKSSSKTISICQQLAKQCYVNAASTLAFRKESTAIPITLKESFNKSIESMYLHPAFEIQDRRYLCENQAGTVSKIVLKGLDNQEKAKGVESIKYVYLDELNQFHQAEFEQIGLSLRGIEGQKILASWNPVDENSWVKTELVDKYEFVDTKHKLPCENSFVKISTCGKVVLIKTTYEDNYWITGSPCKNYGYRDENLISEYEALRTKNANSYKVNVLGEWGKTVFGGEILKNWRTEIHTGFYPYDPEQSVYLFFDENVNPYLPCGIFQVGRNNKSPRLIHVIAAKNPNNTIKSICREINRKLLEWGHKENVYYGGDATSQKEDVKLEKGDDLFRLIGNELKEWKPQRRTNKSNPSVRMSTDFFNSLLIGMVDDMDFGVDTKCRPAIIDFENTKEDKNGKVDKTTVKDPISGVSYQPYGHFFDLTRYFLVTVFPVEYEKYQRGGGSSFSNIQSGKKTTRNNW